MLANASCGLKSGQVLLGKAEDAKRQIQNLFVRNVRSHNVAVAHRRRSSQRVNFVGLKLFRTKYNEFQNSGAVPNLPSTSLMEELKLSFEAKLRKINVTR